MPWPPAGLCTCAASPARKARPRRKRSAMRWAMRNSDAHSTSSTRARCRRGPRRSRIACSSARPGGPAPVGTVGDDAPASSGSGATTARPAPRQEQLQLAARQRPLHADVGEREVLVVRGAVEADAERRPHRAVGAVAADQEAPVDGRAAGRSAGPHRHAVAAGVQAEARDLVAAQRLHPARSQRRQQHGLGRALRHHQHERVARRQRGEVDGEEPPVAVAHRRARDDDARAGEARGQPDRLQHLERARVHRDRPRLGARLLAPLEHDDVRAVGPEGVRERKPGRTRADHDHVGLQRGHGPQDGSRRPGWPNPDRVMQRPPRTALG